MLDRPNLFGRKEWLALPELGLPAIKAKIDTGARTSALHASNIRLANGPDGAVVHFQVSPIPLRPDIRVDCSASVIDEREIVSSNGKKDRRIIITTIAKIGGRSWPIEIGLTDRSSMSHRMLLGRQAIPADVMVDPAGAYYQVKLGASAYKTLSRPTKV